MSEVTGKLEKPLPYEELTHGIIGQAIRDKAMIGNDLHCQDGSLIRLPTLEDKRYCIPLDLISPNPTQPRRYFDPEALNELAGSIESIGQLTPILVVPFIIQIDGHKTIRFFIVGGERRFRALNKLKETHALAVISWNNDEDDLFSKAYIDNYHEKLNVLDEARSIRRMIEDHSRRNPQKSREELENDIGKLAGYKPGKIAQFLQLLSYVEQFPELEESVRNGNLLQSHILNLMRWNRRGRVREESDEARDIQLARQHAVSQILEKINQKKDPQKTTDKSGKPSDITIEDIEQARRSGITEVAGEAKADILAVQRLVARIRTASSQIINSANQLADFDRQTVANALNGMTQPVELVRTRLEKGIFSAAQLHRLVDDIAINNSETNQVENKIKKTFLGRIEKSGVEHFGVDTRYRIAIAIATSTDANNDISTNEIASLLEIPATTIAGSMSLLKKSLKDIGITLITQYRKVRIGTRRELEKIPFYRMSERNTNSEKKKQYIAPSAIGFKAMTSDKNLDKVTGDLCEALKRFFSSNVEITNVKHSPSDDAIIVLEKTGQRSFRISSNIKNFAQRAAVCMPALAGMIRDALGLPEADLTLKDID